METLGEMVFQARNSLKETQESVAKRIKTSTGYISAIETDRAMPAINTIENLAKHLNLNHKRCLACYAKTVLMKRFKNNGINGILKILVTEGSTK